MPAKSKTDFSSVDDYIALQPEPAREVLERVRTAIRNALPDAGELISYKIPAYRIPAGMVLYFAGWKQHYSLYPASPELIAAFQEELAPYAINKSTIRFPITGPVPVKLIGAIAKFRAKEIAGRVNVKAAVSRKR